MWKRIDRYDLAHPREETRRRLLNGTIGNALKTLIVRAKLTLKSQMPG